MMTGFFVFRRRRQNPNFHIQLYFFSSRLLDAVFRMDSLLSNYASSDEEEKPVPPPRRSLLGSLPPPKTSSSSSLFSSLPRPKTTEATSSSSGSSFFSSLPPPKSEQQVELPRHRSNVRKVVKFTPPINPSLLKPLDDDDDDDLNDWKKEKKTFSDFSKKSLADVMPAPKNSMGLGRGASSSGRRYALEADTTSVKKDEVVSASVEERSDIPVSDGFGYVGGLQPEGQLNYGNEDASTYATGSYYGSDAASVDGLEAEAQWNYGEEGASTNWREGNGDYYGDYNGATVEPTSVAPTVPMDFGRIGGKRMRNDIPLDIIEVKQDELVKDRPREDQVKMTGIAFGPAYQPAVSSQKGKISKLHKRKHQIGSLYFDMRQKEMEFTERRAKGMLTKRETQGKYGW